MTSKEKRFDAYVKEMREHIKYVWDELPNEGDEWEQTVEDLEFKIFDLDPFIPTLNDNYDLAYIVAGIIIEEEYA